MPFTLGGDGGMHSQPPIAAGPMGGDCQKCNGVIKESCSPWQNAPVLLPKPDSSVGFCIDFGRLDVVSIFDAYSMHRIDTLLDLIGGAHYLSTIDLTKGYRQIPMDPVSQEKTALLPPQGCITL